LTVVCDNSVSNHTVYSVGMGRHVWGPDQQHFWDSCISGEFIGDTYIGATESPCTLNVCIKAYKSAGDACIRHALNKSK